MSSLKVAVEGCCHGELNQIYRALPEGTDLLLICGDFQALRNITDFKTISVPPKYRRLGDFHQYYNGEKRAPVLTIFIGGNHECSSYLQELRYGGWVAENIYYLGEFGSVRYGGLHIGGISGIYNGHSFWNPHQEIVPYDGSTIRSVYHVKPLAFIKAALMHDVDIMLSHDWPRGIEQHGNIPQLLQKKKHFKNEVSSNTLGSPLNEILLKMLQPRYWFSAHLHVKFHANVSFLQDAPPSVLQNNADEISLDMDTPGIKRTASDIDPKKRIKTKSTHFLALDKCLPKRHFLQVFDMELLGPKELTYDKRSIAINKVVEKSYSRIMTMLNAQNNLMFNPADLELFNDLNKEVSEAAQLIDDKLIIPYNFEPIAPGSNSHNFPPMLRYWPNPQTLRFISKFNFDPDNPFNRNVVRE